jgi:hypothetical protein
VTLDRGEAQLQALSHFSRAVALNHEREDVALALSQRCE